MDKSISIDVQYSYPPQRIKLNLTPTLDRELTDKENYFISNKLEEISELLRRNTKLMSTDFQNQLAEQQNSLLGCFSNRSIHVRKIPNGYWKEALEPWFDVTTAKGIIQIGWRKRVICIDWCNSDIEEKSEELFPEEETTKQDKLIHAWGYDKAKEYIDILLK